MGKDVMHGAAGPLLLAHAGRKQLVAEREEFDRLVAAIRRILQTA
jgi:hypothetical protein